MIKRLIALTMCFLLLLPVCALAENWRIFDNAGLFTADEVQQLEEMIASFQAETKSDFAILTTDDYLGHEETQYLQAFARTFFVSQGFGFGSGQSGLIFYIDNNARKYTLVGDALCHDFLGGETNESIISSMQPDMKNGNYFKAAQAAIEQSLKAYSDYWAQVLAQ